MRTPRTRIALFSFVIVASLCFVRTSNATVKTGLDRLVAEHFKSLEHKHVGIIANQTSRTFDGKFGPSLLHHAGGVHLVALFAPEHGLMGTRPAGAPSDSLEHFEGLPVYSLYGSTRRPTKKMLKGIDVLIFDLQDIGVRPYTYLSTMIEAMQAAADAKIEFIVLDRPNPLGGMRVEGNLRDAALRSFVGALPIPYIHGMTLGEIAKMAVGESWVTKADQLKLRVIPCLGWKRSMYWPQTGLKWVAPSPNIPHFENAAGAAILGATGELGLISIGIGGTEPFLVLGTNGVKPESLLASAQAAFPHGLVWHVDSFAAIVNGMPKHFVGIKVDIPPDLSHSGPLYPGQFTLLSDLMRDSAMRAAFDAASTERIIMFQKVTGTKLLSKALELGQSVQPIIDKWNTEVEGFLRRREKYLLYR